MTMRQSKKSQANKQRVEESTKGGQHLGPAVSGYAEAVTVVTSAEQALSRPLYALTAK
jgi:hypothetical protein